MSNFGCSSIEQFERLKDFPSYTSVIRCFGKPIIPPLLTSQERKEISRLRASAVEKQALKYQKETSKSSEIYNTDREQIFCQKRENCVPYNNFSNHEFSALNSSNLKKFVESSSVNEMHVSMSKIPSDDVCSTVHPNVIVCPNETRRNRNESFSSEPPDSASEYCESCTESGCNCQLCQIKAPDVPYGNVLAENMQSVSEDDQESTAEDTEFASLPTVICNKKAVSQDTDSESIVTCMTQSTDLDKYMDCSIEYSSSEDPAVSSQSLPSNSVSVSSRSDDASTETIVNTENELTPCASAMAELNDCIEESTDVTDMSMNIIAPAGVSGLEVNKRAYSVDSYMKLLRTCQGNLFLRKSQSEPSSSDANPSHNGSFSSNVPSAAANLKTDTQILKNLNTGAGVLEKNLGILEASGGINLPLSNSPRNSESEDEFEKKHIRRNSYTLTHPSDALIKAHADCGYHGDSSQETSPHSCSSGCHNSATNVAFRKETLDLVLPPGPEREKMFPVFKPMNDFSDNELGSDLETVDSLVNTTDEEIRSCPPERYSPLSEVASSVVAEDIHTNLDESYRSSEQEMASGSAELVSRERKLSKSSASQEDFKSTIDNEILKKLFEDLKESHQLRVNQLIEEQNRQWCKLQDDFKDQERTLLERLRSSGISVPSGNSNEEQFATANADFESCNVNTNASVHIPELTQLSASNSNSSNLSSETEPLTIIQNNLDMNQLTEAPKKRSGYAPSNLPAEVDTTQIKEIATFAYAPQSTAVVEKNTNLTGHLSQAHMYDIQQSEGLASGGHIRTGGCVPNRNEIVDGTKHLKGKLPINTVQNVASFKEQTASTSTVNGIGHLNKSVQNSSLQSANNFERSPPAKLCNEVSASMHDLERTSKNKAINCLPINPELKTCNLTKETNSSKNNVLKHSVDQSQMCVINKKNNITMNPDVLPPVKNARKKDDVNTSLPSAMTNGSIENYTSCSSACSSDSSKTNLNIIPTAAFSQVNQASKYPQMQIKSFALPNIPAKAMKLTTSSCLTNLKRRKSKDLNDPEMLRKFEKLPAFVKGYLTRRLLKSERVQELIKTMQETAILIQNLSEELTLKGSSILKSDLELYNKLLAQLLSIFEEVYNIFFALSTREKMKIISESRNFQHRKKMMERLQEASNADLEINRPSSMPDEKPKLSSATVKSIQRKKRSIIDSRTYTREGLREFRRRACSASCQKSHSSSPTRVYQASVGVNLKRKTKSFAKPNPTQHWK